MSGLLNSKQTSGNEWSVRLEGMQYRDFQDIGEKSIPRRQLGSFVDLEAQMTRFESEHEALVNEVRRLYVMSTANQVISYLRGHRTIPQLLVTAHSTLQRYFGMDTVFGLRAPIDEQGWQTLYAVVMWQGSAKNAVAILDQFENQWWLPNSRQAFGCLTFTYELI
ncbi:MAG: hypothetical protein ABI197_00860 [Granulicella sp.]